MPEVIPTELEHQNHFLSFDKNFSFLEKIVNEYLAFECEEIILVMNQNYSEIFNNNFSELFKSKIKVFI